ncbi:uncharacterized protein LOC110463531 [Mizuhopecten yessoensis]|uniref:uncharacterized protein LOC110463531 n=1 Tax=Mizuhopecten yessoensis TaxID=6573 RepID=UPI000B45C2C8|nr:uncharacterized protein LOC110463531 [Mizuhopecten yessoensis]
MDTGRVLWLVIATIMILDFSHVRYIIKDKSIEDKNKLAVTGDTYKLEINKQKVEDDASILTTYDQILIVYESTVENDETMTDDDNIPVVNEQSVEDEHEAATTDDGVLRTPKTIKKNTIVSSLADLSHEPESPTADKETARTDRSNIPRCKTRHMIGKRDLHQWETLLYGWS